MNFIKKNNSKLIRANKQQQQKNHYCFSSMITASKFDTFMPNNYKDLCGN